MALLIALISFAWFVTNIFYANTPCAIAYNCMEMPSAVLCSLLAGISAVIEIHYSIDFNHIERSEKWGWTTFKKNPYYITSPNRCSAKVLDVMCAQMAPTSVSSLLSVEPLISSGESSDSASASPHQQIHPHPISNVFGRLYAVEDFDVLEMLGEGFFSKVSKVCHRSCGEEMVLKVIKPTATGSRRAAHVDAAKEAVMMRKLSHVNVLTLKGVCIEVAANGLWDMHLLVDYCNGGSLTKLILDRSKYFPWQQRVKYALDIATAMEYIHSQGIIHRDLTSMNVLLHCISTTSEWGRAVVADFGLSCPFPKRAERLPQVGTTYFMSPECLKEEFYDEKSDVFSFGVILCQLIARIDADPDSGLHRTSNFGLDYVRFTPCCPLDTPITFLKLAFHSCVESSLMAMEELARCVAREDPTFDHTNPFMDHERYRKERKIIPRKSGRRKSETKPERIADKKEPTAYRNTRRRWFSLPAEINSPNSPGKDATDEGTEGTPGGIPMVYRDFDRVSDNLIMVKREIDSRISSAKLSLYDQNLDVISTSEHCPIAIPIIITEQPLSLSSSQSSLQSFGYSASTVNCLNNNEVSWCKKRETIARSSTAYNARICVPVFEPHRTVKAQKCNIL
uniref:Protein kinase domain-containing protein n=1 Tax=Heterorhabditis bacteriophora TaxID=37862 RepID=A0A1I7W7D3_HETBA